MKEEPLKQYWMKLIKVESFILLSINVIYITITIINTVKMEDMFNVRDSFSEKAYPRDDKETFVLI